MNQSYTYTYDNAGNRTSKKTYAFTTGTLGTVQSTQNYTYGNAAWGDQMTKAGTAEIGYDSIGNPIAIEDPNDYGNEIYMQWQGRRLVRYSRSSIVEYGVMTFRYNDAGIRVEKTVDESESGYYWTHQYLTDGSRIISEIVYNGSAEAYRLIYLYDESGAPIGMQYRTPSMAQGVFYTYWFEKNLQGDIIAVYNEAGTKLFSYVYDAIIRSAIGVITTIPKQDSTI